MIAQLEVLDPGSTLEYHTAAIEFVLEANATAAHRRNLENRGLLEKSNLLPRNKNGLICIPVPGQPRWINGLWDDLNGNIAYLKKLGGCIQINAKSCANIACQSDWEGHGHGSGTFLCNDVRPSRLFLLPVCFLKCLRLICA